MNRKLSTTTLLALILILLFSVLANAEETGFSENGDWYYSIEEDPMTDETTLFFMLPDEEHMGDDFNSYSADALIIRKSPEYEPELFINWSDYLADNNKVRFRFDKENIQSEYWSMSQDSTALFYPGSQEELVDFVKQLLEADQIAIEVKPYEQTREASVFQLKGLGEVLLPHLDILGWEELESVIE